jgi:hypothetical protein
MTTYFVQDETGHVLGWIDAANEKDAKSLADTLYPHSFQISDKPAPDWQIRKQQLQESPSMGFAA